MTTTQHTQNNTPEKNTETKSHVTHGKWEPKKSHSGSLIFLLSIAIAILTVLYIWHLPPFAMDTAYTNNAYVKGQTTLISPKVSGYVQSIFVQDFQHVEKGEALLKIDDEFYQTKVAQAKAALKAQQALLDKLPQTRNVAKSTLTARKAAVESANAQLNFATIEQKRAMELNKTKSISKREIDQIMNVQKQAQSTLDQAKAQYAIAEQDLESLNATEKNLMASVENAQTALDLAQQDLNNTTIYAPESGILSQISTKKGQLVSAGTQLFYLVPQTSWIIANFKEADTEYITIGQAAKISVDALGGKQFEGKVTEIAPATASEFSLIKADSGTGNFVKIAQRIPIKIELLPNQKNLERIKPGMSVEVNINLK